MGNINDDKHLVTIGDRQTNNNKNCNVLFDKKVNKVNVMHIKMKVENVYIRAHNLGTANSYNVAPPF